MSKYLKAEYVYQVINKIIQNATEADAETIMNINLTIEINKLPTIEVSEGEAESIEENIEEPTLTRKEKDFLETLCCNPDCISIYRVEGNNLLVESAFHEIEFYIDPNMFPFIKEGFGMSFKKLRKLKMKGEQDDK